MEKRLRIIHSSGHSFSWCTCVADFRNCKCQYQNWGTLVLAQGLFNPTEGVISHIYVNCNQIQFRSLILLLQTPKLQTSGAKRTRGIEVEVNPQLRDKLYWAVLKLRSEHKLLSFNVLIREIAVENEISTVRYLLSFIPVNIMWQMWCTLHLSHLYVIFV